MYAHISSSIVSTQIETKTKSHEILMKGRLNLPSPEFISHRCSLLSIEVMYHCITHSGMSNFNFSSLQLLTLFFLPLATHASLTICFSSESAYISIHHASSQQEVNGGSPHDTCKQIKLSGCLESSSYRLLPTSNSPLPLSIQHVPALINTMQPLPPHQRLPPLVTHVHPPPSACSESLIHPCPPFKLWLRWRLG